MKRGIVAQLYATFLNQVLEIDIFPGLEKLGKYHTPLHFFRNIKTHFRFPGHNRIWSMGLLSHHHQTPHRNVPSPPVCAVGNGCALWIVVELPITLETKRFLLLPNKIYTPILMIFVNVYYSRVLGLGTIICFSTQITNQRADIMMSDLPGINKQQQWPKRCLIFVTVYSLSLRSPQNKTCLLDIKY